MGYVTANFNTISFHSHGLCSAASMRVLCCLKF
jgi:hypothetical protein